MKYYSTADRTVNVNFKSAVLESIPAGGGLFMPKFIPELSANFLKNLRGQSYHTMSHEVLYPYVKEDVPSDVLHQIIEKALSFDTPLVWLDDTVAILELFHGPTWAFKDIGARFLSGFFSYFAQLGEKEHHILVATSGDTGGAVAAAFYGVEGVRVTLLFPKNKVSLVQQKQLTTWGGNIQAIEIDGSFDDCQRLVKQAFADDQIRRYSPITSANSINIARLLPQMLYYFRLFQQCSDSNVLVSVPSGNFGNLTAGLFANKMGLPISHFIAATNANATVPIFLDTNRYNPQPVISTVSNAMDVSIPSNFLRMLDLYKDDPDSLFTLVQGQSVSDNATIDIINRTYEQFNYIMDPHTAVGLHALKDHLIEGEKGVVLSTAHPIKFKDFIPSVRLQEIFNEQFHSLINKNEKKITMKASFDDLKAYLLE